jgi:hypothetical protein
MIALNSALAEQLVEFKKDVEWNFLKDIWVKRVQDWFLLYFYIIEWYCKENINKEIKVYIPAYSDYDSYYSDDVSIVIFKNEKLLIESIAENDWSSYRFNSKLWLDENWNAKEEKPKIKTSREKILSIRKPIEDINKEINS